MFWLWKQWANVLRIRNDGVPMVGFTWYSLIDQVDWDTALRETNGTVNPLGLFDLDRKIRPVGEAYHKLMMDWQYILPTSSVCLSVPVKRPRLFNQNHSSNSSGERAYRAHGQANAQGANASAAMPSARK